MAKTREVKRLTRKQRIRSIFKRPREKFLTQSQKDYWETLDTNEITLCFGPSRCW